MCARMFFKSHNFMESRQFLPLKPKGQNRYRCQRVYYLLSIKEKLQNNFLMADPLSSQGICRVFSFDRKIFLNK